MALSNDRREFAPDWFACEGCGHLFYANGPLDCSGHLPYPGTDQKLELLCRAQKVISRP